MSRLLLSSIAVLATLTNGEVFTDDVSLAGGRVRYHYDKLSSSACENLLILGVGTGMTTQDYDLIGSTIAKGHNIVAMIVDHNPWWLAKTSAPRYADLANMIVQQIEEGDMLEDLCLGTTPSQILIGGHSASGQAAWNAVDLLDFTPAGYVGLDPFRLNPDDEEMDLPTLMWGFSETTCAVSTDQAAKAGYQASEEGHRVFYKITNDNGEGPGHCSFTDAGCYGPICPSSSDDIWVHAIVGNTVSRFLRAIKSGDFDKSEFSLEGDAVGVPVELYLNEDATGDEDALDASSSWYSWWWSTSSASTGNGLRGSDFWGARV